ncbi:MAG: arsenite methyltransferase [Proteobacteria bacterium]|nr:arsenite methyltransferase [Pseudomonadota bacterium]
MADSDTIHDEVSSFYAKAVAGAANPGACCAGPPSDGIACLAGYDAAEISGIPDDAVASSFGCGNPLAFSGVNPGDVVLDLGSGAGIDIIIAGHKVGASGHVIGVDMTGDMIDHARANIAKAGLDNVEVREGLIEALPVDAASVDWVISNCVINLSPDKPAVFAEIARVLKPGGQMLVSDIVVESLPSWIRESKLLYSACIAGAIDEAAYVEGLVAAGLSDVEVRDRLVYDAAQVGAMIVSDIPAADIDEPADELLHRVANEVAGKIWSASVYARKPLKP